jgi:WD40 repeat protein
MNTPDTSFILKLAGLAATVCLGLLAGCKSPQSPKPTTPAVPVVVPALPIEAPPIENPPPNEPPPAQAIKVELKTIPRWNFAGLRQNDAPQPAWTLEYYHALGQPVISPDGRWLVITRTGDWFKHGEWLVVVDLVSRKATECKIPAPGLVGAAEFSRDGRELLGIINTPEGYGVARWSFPAMQVVIAPLGQGVAIAAALTRAQDRAVVMREDGVISVFDLARSAKQFEVTFQQGKVSFYTTALAISPDDTIVTSGAIHPGNEWVRWRLADGKRLESLAAHEHLAWGRPVAYTASGNALLVAAHHEMMMLAESTGERLATYPGNGLNTLHNQPGVGLAAAPIGQGETFGIIDTQTGQLRMWAKHTARPPAPLGYAGWAAVSPDGKMAYSADYFSVKAWDLAGELGRNPEWLFAGHPASRLFKSPDGHRLLSVGETVDTWDLATRRLLASQPSAWLRGLRGGDQPEWRTGRQTRGLYAVGDRMRAIVLDEEGAQVYDLKDGKAILRIGASRSGAGALTTGVVPGPGGTTSEIRPSPEIFPVQSGYPGLAFSSDGKRLLVTATSGFGSGVTLWSLETGRRLAILGNYTGTPRLARFSTDGRTIIIVTASGGVSLTRFDHTGEQVTETVAPTASREDQATVDASDVLMPAPDRLYVGTKRGVLSTWVRLDGRWHKRIEHQITTANTSFQFPAAISRLAVSPSGRTLAAVLYDHPNDGGILILNAESGLVEARLNDDVSDLCFLGERTLATSSIHIWALDEFPAQAQP